jgi:hypothetical protein
MTLKSDAAPAIFFRVRVMSDEISWCRRLVCSEFWALAFVGWSSAFDMANDRAKSIGVRAPIQSFSFPPVGKLRQLGHVGKNRPSRGQL